MPAHELLLFLGEHSRRARSSDLLWKNKEADMDINWRRDIDAALREAKQTGRPLLLDFTAAPM
jgi:hypothetical protein